jgi:hypothetical protein
MSLIVKHRVNSIKILKKTSKNLGIEVDVRTYNGNLILAHNNYKKKKKIFLREFIKNFNHKFLIVNLKEHNLANKIIKFFANKSIKYFILDIHPHEIIKVKDKKNICARYSCFEPIHGPLKIKKFAEWVWIDYLNKTLITKKNFSLLYKNFKTCIVSPEVAGYKNISHIKKMKNFFKRNKIVPHMICTKKTSFWKNF